MTTTEPATEPDWPDLEAALLDRVFSFPTVVETPDDFPTPLARVNRVGGSVRGVTDRARIEITFYGDKREDAREGDREIRRIMLGFARGGTLPNGVYIDHVHEDTSPTNVPYEDRDVRRPIGVYIVHTRQQ